MTGRAVYFFSDAHLGTDPKDVEARRERRLHDFLASLPGRASALYIVGDLFDFWFEYRTAIPRRYFDTLCELRQLREAGIEITYLTGNHDFWLGSFLSGEMGLTTGPGPLSLELQGRRLWVHHGDGLVGGDLGYRILRRVIRSPLSIGLYRLIHPDLGIPLANAFSRWSRHSRDQRTLDGPRLVREVAAPRFAQGYDAVLVGHFHHAFEHRQDGSDFFVLGDWIKNFTYVKLEQGRLTLETWDSA